MSTRRDFLKLSGLASTALLMPRFLYGLSDSPMTRPDHKLVIIQQSGGNDGLNALVPYRNDLYYRARPQLAVPRSEVLALSDEVGFNPALAPLRDLYDQGHLSLINQVGYPNPDRSHFRAMDIWHSGSGPHDYWDTGWLGRYLDHSCSGCVNPHEVVEIDDTLSLALKGQQGKGMALRNPARLQRSTRGKWVDHLADTGQQDQAQEALGYLYKTLTETRQSAEYLYETSRVYQSRATYPHSHLARDLKTVAELICSGVETSVFYVSLSGFDTHVRQRRQHDRLLGQYAEAVAAFVADLQRQGWFDRTLILTFSEFGRRVAENASGGTDHGKANSLNLIGGALRRPGLYNDMPDLAHLDDGDLPHQIDFRQVYASLLHDWLSTDDQTILRGRFERLDVV